MDRETKKLSAELELWKERARSAERHAAELEKRLAQIKTAVCAQCSGGGEFGLADGEIPCPTCGGSGDPTRPGVFLKKPRHGYMMHRLSCLTLRDPKWKCTCDPIFVEKHRNSEDVLCRCTHRPLQHHYGRACGVCECKLYSAKVD